MASLLLALAAGGCMNSVPRVTPTADVQPAHQAYLLGPGDRLRVIVYGEATLSGEYTVTSAGDVSFPLVGNVPANGRSIEALQEAIRTRLADGYVSDPRVSAEVLNYRPFYILGEVTKPGEYPYAVGLTIPQAVASAGGFTYRANTRRVFLRRASDPAERVVEVGGTGPTKVLPGDTIRVGERYF